MRAFQKKKEEEKTKDAVKDGHQRGSRGGGPFPSVMEIKVSEKKEFGRNKDKDGDRHLIHF